MPYSAYSGIKELFVPEEKLEEAKQEAEEMPSIEISTVGLEFFFLFFVFKNIKTPAGVFYWKANSAVFTKVKEKQKGN